MQIAINAPSLRIVYDDGSARDWQIAIDEPGNSVSVFSDTGAVGTWAYDDWSADYLACLSQLDVRQYVPAVVSAAQARSALLRAGLMAQVEAAVNAAGGEFSIWWEYSTEYHRNHSMVGAISQALSLSDAQVDDLFRKAALI